MIPGDPMKNPVHELFIRALWPVLRFGLYFLFYGQGWLVLPWPGLPQEALTNRWGGSPSGTGPRRGCRC